MKKTLTIAALVLLTSGLSAQDAKSIYKKYSEQPEVTAVYISPAMFKMMGQIPDMEIESEDINLTPAIQALSGMYLLSSENPEINRTLNREIDNLVDKGDYNLFLEVKEDGESVRIYTRKKKDVIKEFVLIASEPDECTFICIQGDISPQMLESLMNEM